jgi:hypothetical protein
MNSETKQSVSPEEKQSPSLVALRTLARLLDELPVQVSLEWMKVTEHGPRAIHQAILTNHRTPVVRYLARRTGRMIAVREPEDSEFGWRVIVKVAGPLDSYVQRGPPERVKGAVWDVKPSDVGTLSFEVGRGQMGGEY